MSASVQYARNGEVHLAYQVLGEGERDVLFLVGGTMPMDALDQHPKGLRVLQGMQRLGRLIVTDPRMIGLSDTTPTEYTIEASADDLEAVVEATDAQDFLLVAVFDACLAAAVYAARRPARLSQLVIYNGFHHMIDAYVDLDHITPALRDAYGEVLDGQDADIDVVAIVAPSEHRDERWRAWFDAAGRRGASPSAAGRRWEEHERADIAEHLPRIAVPTLVLHREDNLMISARHARGLADRIPGAEYRLVPGADHVIYAGDVDVAIDAIAEFAGAPEGGRAGERVLAALLFTDIVESTGKAAELGDRRWRALLDAHDELVTRTLERFSGRLVNTTGDGLVAMFETPGPAVRAAAALRDELRALGIDIRAGVHVAEVERRGADIGGIGVHVAARVMGEAQPGQIMTSAAAPMVMAGSGIDFEDRGARELKGVPGTWQLFAAVL